MVEKAKTKILIVEDERVLNEIYQDKLKSSGYEAVSAFDGQQAIELFTSERPNLILLDVMLPKKSGYDVLKEIREMEKDKKTPVIMISNLGQEEDLKKAKELGADDFLLKSNIKIADVMDKVKKTLEKNS